MSSVVTQVELDPNFAKADNLLEDLYAATVYNDSRFSIPNIVNRLEDIYKVSNEATRYKIFSELVDMEFKEAFPLFLDGLKNDPSGLVRHEAAFGIGIMGNKSHCEALIEALLNDKNPMVRHEAAIAMAELGSQEHIEILAKACEDTHQDVVVSAQFAIQNILVKSALG